MATNSGTHAITAGRAIGHWKTHLLFAPDVVNDLAAPFAQSYIKRLIPHRDPFLFIDEVNLVNVKHRLIRATRRVNPDDPILEGHFPGNPIYPGALQLEGMFQTALVLLYFLVNGTTSPPLEPHVTEAVGTRVYDVFHPSPVKPGDVMTMRCRIDAFDEFLVTAAVQVAVGDRVTSVGMGEFHVL
jgi:3-hydroxymyristoyl/3-hydroxydecanoyl-(acyl carrier protein) dehydratase